MPLRHTWRSLLFIFVALLVACSSADVSTEGSSVSSNVSELERAVEKGATSSSILSNFS